VFKVLMASQHHSSGKAAAGKGACNRANRSMTNTQVYT
jgi:hypothetical protein